MIWPVPSSADLIEAATQAASVHFLPPEIVCAVVEQESGWDPWAIRYEPAFYERYTKPMHLTDTEEYSRAISWGLMQVMGEVARELGYKGPLSKLCEPDVGLDWGCLKLANCFKVHPEAKDALLKWNGGGNPDYPAQVLARVDKYKVAPNNRDDVQTASAGGT